MTSIIFKATFTHEDFKRPLAAANASDPILIPVEDDDGDTMLLLCNILHLRNDKLPSRLPAEALYKLAALAGRYACVVAVGRATSGWFDRLYNASNVYVDTFKIIEAALLLDEATFFVRFTERWITMEPLDTKFTVPVGADDIMRRLSGELFNRRQWLLSTIRADLDLLVDPCSVGFSKTTEHYVDYAPGMSPDPDDQGRLGSICHVDEGAGTIYLGALRDDKIWPATVWPPQIGLIIERVKSFRVPEYDDCDKCDFCEDVKGRFGPAVAMVKKMYAERLWGLCLDCFKAGGFNAGECRYEHSKLRALS